MNLVSDLCTWFAQAVGQETKEDKYSGICRVVLGEGTAVKNKLHLLVITSFMRYLMSSHFRLCSNSLSVLLSKSVRQRSSQEAKGNSAWCYTVGMVLST